MAKQMRRDWQGQMKPEPAPKRGKLCLRLVESSGLSAPRAWAPVPDRRPPENWRKLKAYAVPANPWTPNTGARPEHTASRQQRGAVRHFQNQLARVLARRRAPVRIGPIQLCTCHSADALEWQRIGRRGMAQCWAGMRRLLAGMERASLERGELVSVAANVQRTDMRDFAAGLVNGPRGQLPG